MIDSSLQEAPVRAVELIVDTEHQYLGFGIHPSHCRVRVYVNGEQIVVVISEQADNHGVSVTNAIDQIASEILCEIVPWPGDRRDTVAWIERYPAPMIRENEDTFDLVTFKKFEQFRGQQNTCSRYGRFEVPSWRRISRAEVERLIGMEWE